MNKINLLILMVVISGSAMAGGYHVTNNYYESTTITSGVSNDELAAGLSIAGASGGHQFDFATYDWQGSVVGAWYDDEDAVSFGVGKRFEKVDALFHGAFTQNGSEELVIVGGTFRF